MVDHVTCPLKRRTHRDPFDVAPLFYGVHLGRVERMAVEVDSLKVTCDCYGVGSRFLVRMDLIPRNVGSRAAVAPIHRVYAGCTAHRNYYRFVRRGGSPGGDKRSVACLGRVWTVSSSCFFPTFLVVLEKDRHGASLMAVRIHAVPVSPQILQIRTQAPLTGRSLRCGRRSTRFRLPGRRCAPAGTGTG